MAEIMPKRIRLDVPAGSVVLKPALAKAGARLLCRAADSFSNRTCNDFDLVEDAGLTAGEAREVIRELNRHPDFTSDPFEEDRTCVADWLVMELVARKLEGGSDG